MPVTGFLASIADKAQSAIGHSQQQQQQEQPASGHRSLAFESIQHQLRSLGQQYSSSTTPVQRIITSQKGVALDFDSASKDAKAHSKELYTWGQGDTEDLKDVTDRLAYLNFVQGSLASSLAVKLDASRTPWKVLRDAEAALAPRRHLRAGLHTQLARLEHDNQKGMEKKIAEIKEQIRKAELEDSSAEKEVELLKRKAVRESEQMKWDAIREYGEKLVLLSQAATPIIKALPTLPPSPDSPYVGGKATGAARASLQRALDNYKTGHINLPHEYSEESDLSRSDTRSFGESHASELSSISSRSDLTHPGIPLTPPPTQHALGDPRVTPLDTTHLNLSPAQIPPTGNVPASLPSETPLGITPTVAETGVPVSAVDPGPASGSLLNIRENSSSATSPNSQWESAEAEKKRLQQQYSQASGATPQHETAEQEKRRLEREERERVLAGSGGNPPPAKKDDEDLPPYQDF